MRRNGFLCLAAIGASVIGSAQDKANASISGKLVSDIAYLPVQQGSVTAIRAGVPPFSQTVQIATGGTFQIGSLSAGRYTICVQANGLLDPCQWDLATVVVTVGAGESSTGNALTLKAGSVTTLRLDDPSQVLAANAKAGRSPSILAGIWSGTTTAALAPIVAIASKTILPSPPKQFHPMRMASQDATGSNYEVLIPHNTPLDFHIESPDVVLADLSGLALANNASDVAFQHISSSPTPASFHYQIVGSKL
jgi:hypothetical protein